MWPLSSFFFNILPSSRCTFYPLPNVPAPHPCSSAVRPACCVVWPSFRCLPKALHEQQMGRMGSVSILSSITRIMWWCDTQGTTWGETDLIPFPYKSPPLFRLCKSGRRRKNRCWSNLMWSLWRIRDGNSLWWMHPQARPTLVSHCQAWLRTAVTLCQCRRKGWQNPSSVILWVPIKTGALTVNLHNQPVTFGRRLLQ